MTRASRTQFILVGIGILVLLVSLFVVWDGPQDGSSNLTPPPTGNDREPDSVSPGNRGNEPSNARLETPGSAYPEDTPPNQRRLPPSAGMEKPRVMESTISGIVSNSQDGTPIRGARLTASLAGREDVQIEAVSGHGGRFRMTIRRAGRYTLRAEADGFRRYATNRLFITPADGKVNKNIVMAPQVEIRGQVVDRYSRGIAGASVWLREEIPGPFAMKSMVQSDLSGYFLMAKPPVSGFFFAEAAHPEYELDSRVPVTLPKDDNVVITMHRVPNSQLGSISGHVRDPDGNPIRGATVGLRDYEPNSVRRADLGTSSTDLTGHFFFSKVRRGRLLISAGADGFASPIAGQGNKNLTVEPGRTIEVDLILVRETTVQGVILNDEGLPVADAQVLVRFEKGSGSGAFTPSDGSFKISDVPPGRHRIHVAHRNYVTHESALAAPTSQFFTITLHHGLSLTGYVMDHNNEQIKEFSLRLSPADRQPDINPFPFDPMTANISPSDGYFRINGLTPQTYMLSLRLPNAESLETRLELSESTSVTIVLDPSDSDSPIQVRKSW